MKKKHTLNIHYDEKGDLLELRIGTATAAYYEDLGDDVFERRDEKTHEIKGFAIFNFTKRTKKLKDITVDLPVDVSLTS